jgi:hypothetical protein
MGVEQLNPAVVHSQPGVTQGRAWISVAIRSMVEYRDCVGVVAIKIPAALP